MHDAVLFSSLSPQATDLLSSDTIPAAWHGNNDDMRVFLASSFFSFPDTVKEKCKIWTVVSEVGTAFTPLLGIGQGSIASPLVWSTLVVLLLNTLERIVPDIMNFVPFFKGEEGYHLRHVDAFVENASLGFTSPGTMEYNQPIDQPPSRHSQKWDHILFLVSGGKTKPTVEMFMVYCILGVGGRPPPSTTVCTHPPKNIPTAGRTNNCNIDKEREQQQRNWLECFGWFLWIAWFYQTTLRSYNIQQVYLHRIGKR